MIVQENLGAPESGVLTPDGAAPRDHGPIQLAPPQHAAGPESQQQAGTAAGGSGCYLTAPLPLTHPLTPRTIAAQQQCGVLSLGLAPGSSDDDAREAAPASQASAVVAGRLGPA